MGAQYLGYTNEGLDFVSSVTWPLESSVSGRAVTLAARRASESYKREEEYLFS